MVFKGGGGAYFPGCAPHELATLLADVSTRGVQVVEDGVPWPTIPPVFVNVALQREQGYRQTVCPRCSGPLEPGLPRCVSCKTPLVYG